ncbi:hypothetical protein HS088_TW21G01360 [Tripterygium wilfordii]|uniref:Alpha 1,4-glycosyltransferase domain-containing protein n=1 Tax=Tripterygium wilfordii TaxID=458696 RepID=A0A7J7C4Z5_TRIWF|nr:uncharacterized protein At4g19900 [Tripterygium wilfordii]KAF5729201.1 hypothetical protein HS088_TW21G01360 [Tripterygium wilfordii]
MLRNLRSRRRPRYGVYVCAAISALLLLLSVSLLYTRLTLSPADTYRPHHRGHDAISDSRRNGGFSIQNPLLSDSDDFPDFSTEDKIDELDTPGEQLQQENDNSLFDLEDEGDPISSNKVSSSGFYFDHISNAIRRASNKRSIDEWDDEYVGFNVGLGAEDKSKAALGSDDVPVDENVRRKVIEVEGIEDALMLKVGKRDSPLREGWGEWFDKKGDFLRRDRMFKSNLEVLNPLNNPLLQDPDGVGVTTLTRGDKVVQKWWLNEFKRVSFGGKKPLSHLEGNEVAKVRGNWNEKRDIRSTRHSKVLKEVNVEEDMREIVFRKDDKRGTERRTLDEHAGNGLKNMGANNVDKYLRLRRIGGFSNKSNGMQDNDVSIDLSSKKVNNGDQNLSVSMDGNTSDKSSGIELVRDTSAGELGQKVKLENVASNAHQGKSEFTGHIYADGRTWGYYPGLQPDLSFSDFMEAFFRKGGCDMRVFMVWNSPPWMHSVRHQRGLESLLTHHPEACVVVFSETIELDFFKESFVKDGFRVAVAMPNLDELLSDTPAHVFASVWFEWRKTKLYPVHYSELVRFAALYKYGGIYLDSDIIVLKPLSSLNNTVGLEDQLAGSSLNGAIMAFKKHSAFIMECLKEFYLTYDDARMRWNGADLLTRVAKTFLSKGNKSIRELELKVQPSYTFFPISSKYITRYFVTPTTESGKSQEDNLFNKILIESLTFHFWNSLTSSLIPEPESLVARLINHHCIHCSDVL